MTKELFQFMVSKNVASFKHLKENIGEKVKVVYNKMIDNMPPIQMEIKGKLEDVKNFIGIKVGGKVIYFANKSSIIYEIIQDKTNKVLYDASLVVNKTTKFTKDLLYSLGLVPENSRQAIAATHKFNMDK